jgi:hypothetical protein
MTSTTPTPISGSELSFPTIVLPALTAFPALRQPITTADINASLINTMKTLGYEDAALADFTAIFQHQAAAIIALIGQHPMPVAAAIDAPAKATPFRSAQLAVFLNDAEHKYGTMAKYGAEQLQLGGDIAHGKSTFVPDFELAMAEEPPSTIADLWALCKNFGASSMSHSALFLPVLKVGNPEIFKAMAAEFALVYEKSTKTKSKSKSASPVATVEKSVSMWIKFTSKLKARVDAEITLTVPANMSEKATAHWAALEPSIQTSLLACNSIVAFLEEAKKAEIESSAISSILYALMGKERCRLYTA